MKKKTRLNYEVLVSNNGDLGVVRYNEIFEILREWNLKNNTIELVLNSDTFECDSKLNYDKLTWISLGYL